VNTWTPLWSGIVESSLWDLPDFVVKVFLTMLSVKDADHVVRRNAYAIGKLSRKSEQEVLDALKILSSPDKLRVEKQDYEGRRIEAVEDGFLILNGEKYRAKVQEMMLKAKNMRASANFRARKKGKPEPYPKRPMTPKQQAAYEKGRAKAKKKMTLRDAEIAGRTDQVQESVEAANGNLNGECPNL